MCNIDHIMELLDWNNSSEEQSKGIELAREVKCINVFLQPGPPYSKRVWENCAKVLAERSDEELAPYLIHLLEWIEDLNWPGALCILERLRKYKDNNLIDFALSECKRIAKATDEETWLNNLMMIR